jgi:phospholipase/carboxylesterase
MLSFLALHGSGRDETDLADFCHQLAPQARLIAPRGPFAQADGYTFFRRRSDRSIDAAEVLDLATKWVSQEAEAHLPTPSGVLLAGYSSGAIFAAAMLSVAPERFAGVILLRPEPLSPSFTFSQMRAKPILIVAGNDDERRRRDDAAVLAEQLEAAGAVVSLNVIEAGHEWAPQNGDLALARAWLASVPPK